MYTRCNGIWNCPHGVDEVGCISFLNTLNCSSQHHLCVSVHSNQLICLPVEQANDGNIDCLGATDESEVCRIKSGYRLFEYDKDFYCRNSSSLPCIKDYDLCNERIDCVHGDDEQFCTGNRTDPMFIGMCWPSELLSASDVVKFFCQQIQRINKNPIIDFTIDGIVDEFKNDNKQTLLTSENAMQYQSRCHRGLDLRVWLNNTTNPMDTCLCPPSFYGSQCQYQNQRIPLSVQFRTFSDSWRTLFAVVISLIDDSDQRIVHSYEQFTYLPMIDCKTKFSFYLLYSSRPKNPTNQYKVQVDLYEKFSLQHRGSLLFPVQFSFLPVNRLALIIDIPRSKIETQNCFIAQCIHGKCTKYWNHSQNLTFCQCNEGWFGRDCTFQHMCMCSSNSLCIGKTVDDRPICVCRPNNFGPRCFLTNTVCQNDGQCIPTDVDTISNQTFRCICLKGFSGDRCERIDKQLTLSFDKEITLSESISIHFIQIFNNHAPIRATTFQTMPLRQNVIVINWSQPFHLVFTEPLNKTYYLTVLETIYNHSTITNALIHPSDRCPNISELFNKTFLQWNQRRRIKYYHLPCQKQSLNLSCFHDEAHFCLCYTFNEKRLANCFKFDHTMKFDCSGQSACENDAQCLQDKPHCPTRSICACLPCFYGKLCQFSTSAFGLSLDAIIGYHILPNVSLIDQPIIIHFTLTLTIIFMLLGLINSFLSIITFKNKIVREVGCGLYLLSSSITSLLIIILFQLKFFILLLAQTNIISNRLFLKVQCISIDFSLRVCLSLDQWLNACVAIERLITVMKTTSFDKRKSKRKAKIFQIILLIVVIVSCLHEPIHRRLIDEEKDDDNDVKRIWCTVSYTSNWTVYNFIINICHFIGPFIINLVSTVILIIKKTHQQLKAHKQRSYNEILRKQLQIHKHLLVAPIVLVLLAMPRLTLAFISKCMKSSNDAWLYLVGYFISFIPPMLTFILFIIPSDFYKIEFRKSIKQIQTSVLRCFRLISR